MADRVESFQDLVRAVRARRRAAAVVGNDGPASRVEAEWHAAAEAVEEEAHVLVRLTGFDASVLDSRDADDVREGAVVLEVAGSPTSLSWAARKTDDGPLHLISPDKFRDVVLYAGEAGPFISSKVQVVEGDVGKARDLARRLGAFLSIVGAAGQFTPYGAVIAAAVGFTRAAANAAAQRADDDVELTFLGGLREDPATTGTAVVHRGEDMALSFDIANVAPEPLVKVGKKLLYPTLHVYISDLRIALTTAARRRALLDVSIGVGAATFNERVMFPRKGAPIDHVLAVRNYDVSSAPWTGMVRFSVSVSTVDPKESDNLDEMAGRGRALGQAILEARGRPDDADELGDRAEAAVDVLNAARSFLMEFSQRKTAVGSMHGVFVNAGAVTGLSGDSRSVCPLAFDANGLAETTLDMDTETGGSVSLTLLFRRVAPR